MRKYSLLMVLFLLLAGQFVNAQGPTLLTHADFENGIPAGLRPDKCGRLQQPCRNRKQICENDTELGRNNDNISYVSNSRRLCNSFGV